MAFPVSTRATGAFITAAIWNADIVDNMNDIYSGGRIFGTATKIAFGGSPGADNYVTVSGSHTGSAATRGLLISATLNGVLNANLFGVDISPTLAEFGSGTHPLIAAVYVAPTITNAGGASTVTCGINIATFAAGAGTTTAAGLRIAAAPTGGSANYSLWVDAGITRLDSAVALGGGSAATLGTIGGSGPATAAQNEWIEIHTQNGQRWVPAWA